MRNISISVKNAIECYFVIALLAEMYVREKKRRGGNSHGEIFKKEGTPFGYTVFGLV